MLDYLMETICGMPQWENSQIYTPSTLMETRKRSMDSSDKYCSSAMWRVNDPKPRRIMIEWNSYRSHIRLEDSVSSVFHVTSSWIKNHGLSHKSRNSSPRIGPISMQQCSVKSKSTERTLIRFTNF